MKAVTVVSGRVPLKRSDVDTDQIIPADWLKRVERTGLREGALLDLARRPRLRAQPGAVPGRIGPRRRSGIRCRLVARARRVGDPAGRLRRGDRAQLLRHLPQQLHQERPRAGRVPEATVEQIWAAIEADPTTEIVVDVERLIGRGAGRRHHRRVPHGRADPAPLPRRPRRHRHHADPRRRHRRRTRRPAQPGCRVVSDTT